MRANAWETLSPYLIVLANFGSVEPPSRRDGALRFSYRKRTRCRATAAPRRGRSTWGCNQPCHSASSLQQRFFEREKREKARPRLSHEQLLFEFHALLSALLADVALDAQCHARLDFPVVARCGEVSVILEIRIFASHAAPVCRQVITIGVISDDALQFLPDLIAAYYS